MAFAMRRGSRFSSVTTLLLLLLGGYWFLYIRPLWRTDAGPPPPPPSPAQGSKSVVEIVVASTKQEDTTWVNRYLPDWSRKIYVVNDSKAPLTVAVNKGREAMVYLTHLIDNYDSLHDITVFMHAGRFQWHNDDPDYDALPALRNLNTDYVRETGYANLRCVWVLGCPVEIRPIADELPEGQKPEKGELMTKHIYKRAFEALLPGVEPPTEVGVSCCSQFAVTRETVRRRPKEDYLRFRQWLVDTPLGDDYSGRVLEYAWHIIFGKKAVHCPAAHDCYCNLFGLCNLTCTERECNGRYVLPKFASLPKGWPLKGFKGEDREFAGPMD